MDEKKLKYVTYCGLYCKLCAQCGRIPQQAQAIKTLMEREGYTFYGPTMPNFTEFWSFLDHLAALDETCPACRGGCGDPGCKIRPCASEREVVACPFCDEYPCERFESLAKRYPTLIADGQRMKAVGIDAWIAEVDKRAATGFCYGDIRYTG